MEYKQKSQHNKLVIKCLIANLSVGESQKKNCSWLAGIFF